jgi:hypothetical protein
MTKVKITPTHIFVNGKNLDFVIPHTFVFSKSRNFASTPIESSGSPNGQILILYQPVYFNTHVCVINLHTQKWHIFKCHSFRSPTWSRNSRCVALQYCIGDYGQSCNICCIINTITFSSYTHKLIDIEMALHFTNTSLVVDKKYHIIEPIIYIATELSKYIITPLAHLVVDILDPIQ